MPFVSITRLRLRSWRYLPMFIVQAIRSARQAREAAGNLRISMMRERGNVYWTRTLWDSEDSMKAYMLAGVHRNVMRKLLDWCNEAAVAHWIQESPEPPSWEQSHAQVVRIGRPSKVSHPSEVQRSFQIPPPCIAPGREVRWK